MQAKRLEIDPYDYELDLEFDEEKGTLLCGVAAAGATPVEFFGDAAVVGVNEDGDECREWLIGANRYCPFREDAIETLMAVWAEHFGAITRGEVEAAFRAAHPEAPVDYRTRGDRGCRHDGSICLSTSAFDTSRSENGICLRCRRSATTE